MRHLVDDFNVDRVPPAGLDPRPRVCVVEDLSLGEVAAVGVDPSIIDDQCVVPVNSNWCFILIVCHDIELPSVWMAKPAFAIGGRGAGAPALHGPIVASELCVFGTTCRRLEVWVPRIAIADVRLRGRGCSSVEDTGANGPFERVKKGSLDTPEFIEGVEVIGSDPSEHLGEGHPNPLRKTHVCTILALEYVYETETELSGLQNKGSFLRHEKRKFLGTSHLNGRTTTDYGDIF